jgi:hypothetical protein
MATRNITLLFSVALGVGPVAVGTVAVISVSNTNIKDAAVAVSMATTQGRNTANIYGVYTVPLTGRA